MRRDKYPQFFTGLLSESAANTFTTTSINIPTNLLMQGGSRRTIIEVLWIELAIDTSGDDGATGSYTQVSFSIGSTPTAIIPLSDPRCFTFWSRGQIITTSGLVEYHYPVKLSLQSNDGFGFLLAGDRFHISILGVSQTNAQALRWRIYYREVGVSVMEYVGIVQQQSQQ